MSKDTKKRGTRHPATSAATSPPPPGGPLRVSGDKPVHMRRTLRRLMSYLRPQLFFLVAVSIITVFQTLLDVYAPKKLGEGTTTIYDGFLSLSNGGEGVDLSALSQILLTVLIVYALSAVFSYLEILIMTKVTQKIVYRLRQDAEEKLNRLSLSFYDTHSKGDMLSRVVNDVDLISSTLQENLTQSVYAVVALTGIVVMMLLISPLLMLLVFLTLPLSFGIALAVAKKTQGLYLNQQRSLGALDAHIEESYAGHLELIAFNHSKQALKEFELVNGRYFHNAWRAQFFSGLTRPFTQMLGNIGYIAVAVAGSAQLIAGQISVGDVQAFLQYMRLFSRPIETLASIMNTIQATLAACERVFELLDAKEVVKTNLQNSCVRQKANLQTLASRKRPSRAATDTARKPATAADALPATWGAEPTAEQQTAQASQKQHALHAHVEGHLVFENLSFSYVAGKSVIKDFSLEVQPGQTIAIVGQTGAGKTTLANLLMRFYEPDSGAIFLDGRDISTMNYHELRSHFALVLQDTWLFSGTIAQNIAYGHPGASREEISKAAHLAFADHFIKTLPEGYDTVVNEGASNLSNGQCQLLSIARAFAYNPQILILDEATSSIDTRTERLVQDGAVRLMSKRTCFVIAHRLSTIRNADCILVLQNGSIAEQGNHKELMAAHGVYAELYNAQF